MPVFRWGRNWDAIQDLEREVDRLLQGVNLTIQGVRFARRYPLLNLRELADEYVITAEIPGVKTEDLDISVAGGVLSIKGSRQALAEIPEEHFRRRERFHGSWQRSISLPERVDDSKMSAELTNGILKIRLPRLKDIRPRQIPVFEGSD